MKPAPEPETRERWFYIPMPIFVPGVLSLAALGWALCVSPHALIAIPFVCLGAVCSAPNWNLANGCLAWVAMGIGIGAMFTFTWWGGWVAVAIFLSWFLSGFERVKRAKPVDKN